MFYVENTCLQKYWFFVYIYKYLKNNVAGDLYFLDLFQNSNIESK